MDVEIFKIYSNNIIQFLQVNELAGDYQLSRVGRVVYQKQVPLKDLNPSANYARWERFALDLSDLVDEDPNAIYQVRLGFQKAYSTYYCNATIDDEGIEDDYNPRNASQEGDIVSFYDYRYRYWNYEGYRWDHRNDPCYPPYYGVHNFIARNVVASDLGLIAKRGDDGTISVAVSSLTTAQPVSSASLEFYDYQQQLIGSVTSDGQGMATLELDRKPFVLLARSNNIRGYLKMNDGESVSLSRFDVSGARPQKGLKGYIYGERGVWRPGDSLYLTFILEDKKRTLPEGHPISLEFIDARGNLKTKLSAQTNRFQMYPFALATADDDPTGNWQVKVKVGGATFQQPIKIETVKPNRLKVKLDFGTDELVASGDLNGQLQVNWLHGAPAQNLRTQIDYQVYSVNTTFPKFGEFEFDDPARRSSYSPQTLFDGEVDANGQATVNGDLNIRKSAPGKMKVNFSLRAFEKGGDFSSDNFSMAYSPYDQYAGLRIPKNKWGSKRFEIEKNNELEVVLVDKDGNPVANQEISLGLYKVKWRWWWENSNERNTNFASSTHYGSITKETLTTDSKGSAKWTVKPDDWGRYLIRVCDPNSGHCSGDYFYAGYPWYGDDENSKKAAAILAFNSDKQTYEVGETVKLSIPSSQQGRALISIENGSRVVESYWTDLKDGETTFQFYATEEMTPTVYANVSLIQPHGQTENDLPIRMYGVIPIKVENPDTKLAPVLKMDDVLRPEESFTVEVSEKNKKGMSYTLAVVDEGLLDLTRFKTPDPWNTFYAREALGVKTWDVYDYVLGAYGGELERVLSIGGDGEAGPKGGQKANRFKPVVTHLGPFYLKPGQKVTHEINMPNYVGSVRTMVVAADNEGAYGNAEKTTPVRNPLMVLATLPRVLGPGEIVELPVNVFAMENNVKNVDVKVEVNDKLEIMGTSTKNVRFNQIGDEIVYFRLKVKEGLGVAEVKVSANGNGEKASQEIELDVRNPNPYITDILQAVLQPGQDWTQAFSLPGMAGTNSATLELSTFPPIDLGRRLRYLIRYPHGCIEQTTSGAFPQLYLSKLVELSDEQKTKSENNVRAGLTRLRNFQTASGGFGYWPGDNSISNWGNTYAGHFMLEAKALGYTLPPNMLDRWKSAQRKAARNWTPITNRNDYRYRNDALQQSYRLYTLALAGSPELGAMNRLRERPNLPKTAKWRLAAAYAQAGKIDVAKALVKDIDTKVDQYQELGYSYGSSLRDRAMILETLILINDKPT
ncbi:MAG: MG2 domain-containing protein, partial [Bacteroidota bacterium]